MVKICLGFLWKGTVIGCLNVISLVLASGVLMNLGLKFPEFKGDYTFLSFIMFLSGFIVSIIGGIIVSNLKLSKLRVLLTLQLMFFLNTVTQMLEAVFFAPGLVSWEVVPAIIAQQFIMYLFVSAGLTLLFKYKEKDDCEVQLQQKGWSSWFLRILISSGSYVLFYFIFGSINAALFTGEYYRSQVNGLRLPSTFEILMLEPVRAVALVISVLPVILHLNVSKNKRMVMVGMVLFVIGGFLPMLQQINTLPTVIVVSSIFEMFFQFFLTGVVITYILLYEKGRKIS